MPCQPHYDIHAEGTVQALGMLANWGGVLEHRDVLWKNENIIGKNWF